MKASLDLKKRNCKMRKFLKILLVYAIEKIFLIFLPEAYKEYFYIIMLLWKIPKFAYVWKVELRLIFIFLLFLNKFSYYNMYSTKK